jgi:DeoR family transcriptional regulator of aga operon
LARKLTLGFAHSSARYARIAQARNAKTLDFAGMRQAERVGAILEQLSERGSVSVADLAADLSVSPATIRRDLELLDDQRLLTRTHGGAVAQGVMYELPLRYKSARHQEEKRRIGLEAATRVADGEAVGLTGGTTTTEVARVLVERQRLTVVTNALNIASELAIRPNLKLVVTGGWARSESYELVGPLAEQSLAGLNLDTVFVGVDGASFEAGLMTHHEVEAHTNMALIERARRTVVVADSSKIGRTAFARICAIDRVHELITDAGADARAVDAIREAGVTVTTV